jgi:predicted metallopeptidase
LSNEQISAYQYYLGNYTMSMMNWRMASPRYARLPDTEKVRIFAQDIEDVDAAVKSALFGHDIRRLTRRQRSMRNNLVNSPLGQSMPPR